MKNIKDFIKEHEFIKMCPDCGSEMQTKDKKFYVCMNCGRQISILQKYNNKEGE